MEAYEAGNGQKAEKHMKLHLQAAREELIDYLKEHHQFI